MTEQEKKKRRVGRPKDVAEDAGRKALIEAGAVIFSRKGYAATKIAELAKEAGVTPAMVHYYFDGKQQLLEVVLAEAFDPLMAQIGEIDSLDEWVKAFHGLLLKYRWLPNLMQREVLMSGGHLTEMFLARYGSRVAPKWFELMVAEKKAGRLRPDVDEFRHVVFMVAMLVHPFLIGQMKMPFHEAGFTDQELERFRDDALAMFRNGTSP